MLESMTYAWWFDPDAKEFHAVLPLMVRNDPDAYYVIRDGLGDLWVHDPWGRECPAHFEHVEVYGMTFDREQFDPDRVDALRMTKELPLRSLFSLLPEQVDELRAEMRRDGQWMREQLNIRRGR